MQRFLRRGEVESTCGLPTSTLYALMDRGEFPKPIKISSRTVAWLETDIIEWQRKLIAAAEAA